MKALGGNLALITSLANNFSLSNVDILNFVYQKECDRKVITEMESGRREKEVCCNLKPLLT